LKDNNAPSPAQPDLLHVLKRNDTLYLTSTAHESTIPNIASILITCCTMKSNI